jgi:hypothetical protein
MRSKKWWLGLALLALGVAGGVAWMERASLRAWYVLRGLRGAGDHDRATWVQRVADLGELAVDGLVDCLSSGDQQACRNAVAALDHLARTWGASDARTGDLACRLACAFGRLCPRGQAALLRGMAGWFAEQAPAAGLVSACARLLDEAAGGEDETVAAGLDLAGALLRQPHTSEAIRAARELARAALRSRDAGNRLRGVRLALLPGLDLLEQVVALLRDPAVEVRRAAIVAVGPADQVVRDEGLLPCLHDADAEVRRLTEEALRGRGLRPEHLELGRLLTHPQARQRLQVIDHLYAENTDLDPGLWLRRLSHDSSPAVRAAAVRVMSQQSLIDLTDRIDQMARSDPSPTVAQLARFYLHSKRRPEAPAER